MSAIAQTALVPVFGFQDTLLQEQASNYVFVTCPPLNGTTYYVWLNVMAEEGAGAWIIVDDLRKVGYPVNVSGGVFGETGVKFYRSRESGFQQVYEPLDNDIRDPKYYLWQLPTHPGLQGTNGRGWVVTTEPPATATLEERWVWADAEETGRNPSDSEFKGAYTGSTWYLNTDDTITGTFIPRGAVRGSDNLGAHDTAAELTITALSSVADLDYVEYVTPATNIAAGLTFTTFTAGWREYTADNGLTFREHPRQSLADPLILHSTKVVDGSDTDFNFQHLWWDANASLWRMTNSANVNSYPQAQYGGDPSSAAGTYQFYSDASTYTGATITLTESTYVGAEDAVLGTLVRSGEGAPLICVVPQMYGTSIDDEYFFSYTKLVPTRWSYGAF